MTAPIIRHAELSEVADYVEHPNPALDALDVCAIKKAGGATLTVIIAKPLQADERSQARLLDKIQGYLGHIATAESRAEAGDPTSENTAILVKIHPDSDPAIFDLLKR